MHALPRPGAAVAEGAGASRRRAQAHPQVLKYAAFQGLLLDEWLLDRPDELFRGFLLELMGARYGTSSTVFFTRFRRKDRHERLGGGVNANADMDMNYICVWSSPSFGNDHGNLSGLGTQLFRVRSRARR